MEYTYWSTHDACAMPAVVPFTPLRPVNFPIWEGFAMPSLRAVRVPSPLCRLVAPSSLPLSGTCRHHLLNT